MLARAVNIGSVALTCDQPRVIAPFTDQTPLQALVRAHQEGLDLLEARVDHFSNYDPRYVLGKIAQSPAGMPVLATLRSQREGGKWRGTERERLSLFSALLPKVDAVDIELNSADILGEVVKIAKDAQKTLIISFHDFQAVPSLDVLNDLVKRAMERGADIAKIAATVRSTRDVQVLASLTIAQAERNVVVLGMGPEGLKTRLLLPALGSLMTFAYVDQPSAPGQLSVAQTVQLLRALYPAYAADMPGSLTP